MPDIFNVFPLTIYVDRVSKHEIYKEDFYKLYPKYDYVENERSNTVSEGQVDPLIHLEPTLSPLFTEIAGHVRRYIYDNEIIKLNFPVSLKKVKVIIPNIVPTTPPMIIMNPIL